MPYLVKIQQARLENVAQIATVHVRAWQSAYRGLLPDDLLDSLSIPQRAAMWERALSSPNVDISIAINENDGIVGFATAHQTRDADAPLERGEVGAIYTLESVWGKRVGYQLMRAALEALRRRTFTEASLWVLDNNARGIHFYERFGFQADTSRAGIRFEQLGSATVREVRYLINLAKERDNE